MAVIDVFHGLNAGYVAIEFYRGLDLAGVLGFFYSFESLEYGEGAYGAVEKAYRMYKGVATVWSDMHDAINTVDEMLLQGDYDGFLNKVAGMLKVVYVRRAL